MSARPLRTLVPPTRTLALLAPVLLAVPARAQEGAPPLDPARVARAFEQARAIIARDAGALWGIPLDYPLLVIDPGTRACLADRPDEGGLLRETDGLWAGRYPDDRPVANAPMRWSGVRWTMLMAPLPESDEDCAKLVLHESFHNAQFELRMMSGGGPALHLDGYDGRLWLRLEARALARALAHPMAQTGLEREEALLDALLFRHHRRALLPESAAAEDGLERLEGTAQYTGIALAATDPERRAALAIQELRRLPERPSLTRSFQYATGPALGVLLDALDPHWREPFLEGATFGELLDDILLFEAPAEDDARASLAHERALDYGYEELEAQERERERERRSRLASYRARFLEGPVLVLEGSSLERSFDPSRIESLEGAGLVYGTLWASAEWGVLDAPGGALVRDDVTVVVSLGTGADSIAERESEEGTVLTGEGWSLTLAAGWGVGPGERAGDLRLVTQDG